MPTKKELFLQTVRAQWLGVRMRALRDDRGLTLKYVGEYLGVEFSTLARYERAEWPFRRDHVLALLDLYGVYDEVERADLLRLAQETWRINQWDQEFGAAEFVDSPWLEARAQEICVYSAVTVPDLLRTPGYAEALARADGVTGNRVGRLVNHCVERQRVLDPRSGPVLSVVLEESVLRRPAGDPGVTRDQIAHLRDAGRRPRIEVRVLPTVTGLHGGLQGGFTVYRMPAPYQPVSCVEHLNGRLFMEATHAARHSERFTRLAEMALSEEESVALVAKLLRELG